MRKRGTDAKETVMEVTGKYLEARRQIRPKFGCVARFVSALFETVIDEGICGRFGRIGV
jgi:hypothetical protein